VCETEMAGTVWLNAFFWKRKFAISICRPEANILARAVNFNHASVSIFSKSLSKVLVENKFEPHIFKEGFWNIDAVLSLHSSLKDICVKCKYKHFYKLFMEYC
jgi:hypothetical protein